MVYQDSFQSFYDIEIFETIMKDNLTLLKLRLFFLLSSHSQKSLLRSFEKKI